jgi:hypothetical protein
MSFNNCVNNKLTEYGNKNFLVHQHSKSIDLPKIVLPKINENSLSEKSIVFKLNPSKKMIMSDLSNLLDRYDSESTIKEIKSEIPRNKVINSRENQLDYYERFYNKFKVSDYLIRFLIRNM